MVQCVAGSEEVQVMIGGGEGGRVEEGISVVERVASIVADWEAKSFVVLAKIIFTLAQLPTTAHSCHRRDDKSI